MGSGPEWPLGSTIPRHIDLPSLFGSKCLDFKLDLNLSKFVIATSGVTSKHLVDLTKSVPYHGKEIVWIPLVFLGMKGVKMTISSLPLDDFGEN